MTPRVAPQPGETPWWFRIGLVGLAAGVVTPFVLVLLTLALDSTAQVAIAGLEAVEARPNLALPDGEWDVRVGLLAVLAILGVRAVVKLTRSGETRAPSGLRQIAARWNNWLVLGGSLLGITIVSLRLGAAGLVLPPVIYQVLVGGAWAWVNLTVVWLSTSFAWWALTRAAVSAQRSRPVRVLGGSFGLTALAVGIPLVVLPARVTTSDVERQAEALGAALEQVDDALPELGGSRGGTGGATALSPARYTPHECMEELSYREDFGYGNRGPSDVGVVTHRIEKRFPDVQHEAHDIVIDALLRICAKSPDKDSGKLVSLLEKAAQNGAIDRLRKRKRMTRWQPDLQAYEQCRLSQAAEGSAEARAAVDAAIEQGLAELSERDRNLIEDRYIRELTYPEMAAQTIGDRKPKTPDAMRKATDRALERLKAHLEQSCT